MTKCGFCGYKYLIYEPNHTKILNKYGYYAAHKPCKFQEYQSRESSLWGENHKISDFGVIAVGYVLPNLTPIGAFVHPMGQKPKTSF